MRKIIMTGLAALFAANLAFAQAPATPATPATPAAASDCEAKAVSKEGKPLAGAAKSSFIKKCQAESKGGNASAACEAKAVSKEGKPLAGAAKASFMKKCQADASK